MSLRRFHGWEPRTTSTRHADGTTVTVTEPEYDDWERMIQAAYDDYMDGLCPDCGHPMSESLWDASVPADERPQWQAGFVECRACEVLEITMGEQARRDQAAEKTLTGPLPTHHRHWHVEQMPSIAERSRRDRQTHQGHPLRQG